MDAITPGGATKDGENGADYWLVHDDELPDYYISKSELEKLGWKRGRSPKKMGTWEDGIWRHISKQE